MPYASSINDNTNYNLEVAVTSGSAAVTVVSIKSSGAVSAESLVNPNGSRSVGNGVVRIVFILNAQQNISGILKLSQSGLTLGEYAFGGTAPLDLTVTADIV